MPLPPHAAAALRAYGQVQRSAAQGRGAEAEAFARAAALLTRAQDRPHDRGLLIKALSFNQKLWCIMEAEVFDPGHPAPATIRRDMTDLARFMEGATARAQAGLNGSGLAAMIDVNKHLAEGLFVGLRRG